MVPCPLRRARSRTTMVRSTDSRRARNSACETIFERLRSSSRFSVRRRRCASRREEPRIAFGSSMTSTWESSSRSSAAALTVSPSSLVDALFARRLSAREGALKMGTYAGASVDSGAGVTSGSTSVNNSSLPSMSSGSSRASLSVGSSGSSLSVATSSLSTFSSIWRISFSTSLRTRLRIFSSASAAASSEAASRWAGAGSLRASRSFSLSARDSDDCATLTNPISVSATMTSFDGTPSNLASWNTRVLSLSWLRSNSAALRCVSESVELSSVATENLHSLSGLRGRAPGAGDLLRRRRRTVPPRPGMRL